MNVLLRGIIGGLAGGGAPRPSGAGSTRQPAGWVSGGAGFGGGASFGAVFSAGESEGKHQMYSGETSSLKRRVIQTPR